MKGKEVSKKYVKNKFSAKKIFYSIEEYEDTLNDHVDSNSNSNTSYKILIGHEDQLTSNYEKNDLMNELR